MLQQLNIKRSGRRIGKVKIASCRIRKQKQEIRRQAQKEAWEITKQARQESEAWLKEFKEARKNGQASPWGNGKD